MIKTLNLYILLHVCTFAFAQSTQNIEIKRSFSANSKGQIIAHIHEKKSKNKILTADIWIGKKRYPADSIGMIVINNISGSVKLTARGFNYQNQDYKVQINKNEIVELHFYLEPYTLVD